MLQQPFRIIFKAGDDLAAIQARCALANLAGFQHLHGKAEPGCMQGGRQTEDPATDNNDIDALPAGKKRLELRGRRRLLPDRIGKRYRQRSPEMGFVK